MGVQNAIDEVWGHLESLMTKFTSDQIRSTISKFIDTYIQEKIDLAQ
jgi:hypothetical protein